MFWVSAYVLTKIEAGKEEEVLKEVEAIEGVKKASITYGTYDSVVEVSFEKIQKLDKFLYFRVRIAYDSSNKRNNECNML